MIVDGEASLDPADRRTLNEHAGRISRVAVVAAVAGLLVAVVAASLAEQSLRRFAHAYLTSFAFFLSLSLGSLLFVLLAHLFRAGWSVLVRRVAEVFAANLLTLAVLSVPIMAFVLLPDGGLYPWAQDFDANHAEHAAATVAAVADRAMDAHAPAGAEHARPGADGAPVHESDAELAYLVEGKRLWLNTPFFIVRWVVCLVIWCGMALWYWKTSLRQDETADPELTRKMEVFSAPGTLIFAFTFTAAAFDLLMSLDPTWFSTIFGVYYFAGAMMASIAALILALVGLQQLGLLPSVNTEHYHDLGKFMFAFVIFWAYIAYSQYMLIWYGSLPAEIPWLADRGLSTSSANESQYQLVALFLLFGHFVIPFLGLLSRHVKRHKAALAFWAVWLLVAHWIDVYWLVMPSFDASRFTLGLTELGCGVGIGGLFLASAIRLAAGHSLVPTADPRLAESLAFRNT